MTSGEVNETIMQSLLEQGRLRLDQLITSVAHKLERPLEDSRELLQRHFFGLVQVGPVLHTTQTDMELHKSFRYRDTV